jgi:hypothetical protein
VLAIFLNYAGAQSALAGAAFALLAWCGFVITISIGQAAFGWMSWTRLVVGAGESLLGYALMGAINDTRLKVWAAQPPAFFEEAIIDADGSVRWALRRQDALFLVR